NMSKNALLFSLVISVAVTLIGLQSTEFLMRQLGAEGSYLQSALDYIDVVILGSFFIIGGMFVNALLYAQGDTISFR
ncbi:MAG: MATE family efflux transporter, partial [Helicobacteraceae bacterium]|nr:MATE family efflux transporter [Helicobacteraceae bacterium]